MSETTSRQIVIKMETLEKLLKLQEKRGFPGKNISEGEVIDEAVEKLYKSEVEEVGRPS